jgi:hypothetical protein
VKENGYSLHSKMFYCHAVALSFLWLIWQVDYSGFMTINPQRFGQKYVGKVPSITSHPRSVYECLFLLSNIFERLLILKFC